MSRGICSSVFRRYLFRSSHSDSVGTGSGWKKEMRKEYPRSLHGQSPGRSDSGRACYSRMAPAYMRQQVNSCPIGTMEK
nr:MAG TPA: hypothetical protein [Caudoviricetes sp.]